MRAQADLGHGRGALASAVAELFAQAAVFAPYAHGDLRPLLGVTETAPWPGASSWPTAEQATAALVGAPPRRGQDPRRARRGDQCGPAGRRPS